MNGNRQGGGYAMEGRDSLEIRRGREAHRRIRKGKKRQKYTQRKGSTREGGSGKGEREGGERMN